MMSLNKLSFKILSERELVESADIARREVYNTTKRPREHDDAWLAQCWMEGIFTSMIKSGYTIVLEKDGQQIKLEK